MAWEASAAAAVRASPRTAQRARRLSIIQPEASAVTDRALHHLVDLALEFADGMLAAGAICKGRPVLVRVQGTSREQGDPYDSVIVTLTEATT